MTTPDTGPDAVPASVTHREIQEILATFARSGWSAMELDVRGIRVSVGKHGPPAAATVTAAAPPAPAPTAAAPAPAPAPAPTPPPAPTPAAAEPVTPTDRTGLVAVRSPAVGAFWVAPSPGQPPFVAVGDHVAADAQLAIVEVMKLMNPVVTPAAGEVVEVCAGNADLVEYDQVLFWLRPDG
ncbi:acetyl-CoA carboxylase biotin carboxyl carrier protein [Actinomycetospora aeridis]|uniref:Biotin carboxyl carrier protein of acetyl-CoA carboxylase n=1 Tax=Actinomycetospora aeridis TaxID=3129231 RepID=A0ABU8NDT2_9PSEU